MPRRCEGPSASAHSAATAGRQLADVVQVDVEAVQAAGAARRAGPRPTSDTAQPIRARMPRSASPACVVARGQSRTVTRPPDDRGQRQERRRVGEVGLDRGGRSAATGPGRDRPAVRRRASSTSTPCARSIATVMSMWGSDGTGLPIVAHVHALLVARAGQQQGGDELRGRRGVDDDRAAGDPAAAAHGERQGSGPAVVDLARRARAARRAPRRSGGCACAGRRRR